jgi:hypothetical protein
MNSQKKCPFQNINTIVKWNTIEIIKWILQKKLKKILNRKNTKVLPLLDDISFYLLEELDNIEFDSYIDKSDLYHDKDLNYFLKLFKSIITPILDKYPLKSSNKNILENFLWKKISNWWAIDHLCNLYSIAFFDMHSIICLESNSNLNSSEWKKIVLWNMYGWKTTEWCTPSDLIFTSILYEEGEEIVKKLHKINTLAKNSCPYIQSNRKMDFINRSFIILKEKLIPKLQEYEKYIDKKYDIQGVYLFWLNKKTEE